MGTLQSYVNPDEIEIQAKGELADLKYIGPLSFLHDKRGKGYYIKSEDKWYFTPNGSTETYRVKIENLDFER
jgi:hypothetical protein